MEADPNGFGDYYPPAYYANLLTQLNESDDKLRRAALDELNVALDGGQFPGEDVANKVDELVRTETNISMREVSKLVQYECTKTRIEEAGVSIGSMIAAIEERKRNLSFFSRPKVWQIDDLPAADLKLKQAAAIRSRVRELEKEKEERWGLGDPPASETAELTEMRLCNRSIGIALAELEALVPEMLKDAEIRLLADNRKAEAHRVAEEKVQADKLEAAFVALAAINPEAAQLARDENATYLQVMDELKWAEKKAAEGGDESQ